MCRLASEQGFALLIAVIVLALFCLIGFYLALNAATEMRIGDNYESEIHARFAAYAGLDHARAALRGLENDDLLQGPDGVYDPDPARMAEARTFAFRNALTWSVARTLDIIDPDIGIGSLPDDGILNTGRYQSTPGTALIPGTGVALIIPASSGPGAVGARYFVKVTDNNGEASERAGDPLDNPFVDGDGLILVRSTGVAPASPESAGGAARTNSVVVFETRLQRPLAFDLPASLIIQGLSAQSLSGPMFEGNSIVIQGGSEHPGIGTLDVDGSDALRPSVQIALQVAPGQENCIQGLGLLPSILDLTTAFQSDPPKAQLLSKDYVWDFVRRRVGNFADSLHRGDQDWTQGNAPDLGSYDRSLPMKAPGQRPRVAVVDGNLAVGGGASGGGLLVVTGRLSVRGPFTYTGLIVVVGSGEIDVSGTSWALAGGIYVVSISDSGGALQWGTAGLRVGGSGSLVFDRAAIRMAISLIPPDQVGFREITSAMDP